MKRKDAPSGQTLLLLTMLEEEPNYGSRIIYLLECRADPTFSLDEGAIYPILHSLEERGDVRSALKPDTEGKLHRYYRLTRQGVRTMKKGCQESALHSRAKALGGEACVRR